MLNRQMKNSGRGRGRSDRRSDRVCPSKRLVMAGVLAGLTSVPALAGPRGEKVVHGSATFNRQGAHTTITASDRAIINYQSFNLNRHESVRFVQPSSQASVLNRIKGGTPSSLDGAIFANGNVYFVNPAGIYFGPNSVVNVGGIYAAAGSISNADFLRNVNQFTNLSGDVINHGVINADAGVHLVGRRVANFGRIVSPDGLITMSAGADVLIGEQGGRVFARIKGDASAAGAVGVENHGVIDAGSGRVLAGVGDHFALALYDTSVIRGSSVRVAGGKNSTVHVRGEIDASNASGKGGEIDVLGGRVGLEGATLDASGARGGGEIHVGGDFQGRGDRLGSDVTYVDAGSTLRVDATEKGNAGRAIVWSDGATFFRGEISATGPRKGGFAEVSGKEYLDFNGTFDLRGELSNGTLLLDPKDITILPNGSGGTSNDPNDFNDFTVDPSLSSTIDADDLSLWLDGGFGAQIILQASNDIQFVGGANVVQTAGDVDLVLEAGRHILFLTGSSLSLFNGNLIATANAAGFVPGERDPGQGIFGVLSGASVTSSGGALGVTVDATDDGLRNPGPVAILGGFNAPTITITSQHLSKGVVAFVGDQDVANIAFGADLTIEAGLAAVFLQNGGDAWSFSSLDVTAAVMLFDDQASGVTATGAGGLAFTSGPGQSGLTTSASGTFTFTGPTTLNANYDAAGEVVFAGTLNLGADIIADGNITFEQDVTLTGALATITLDDSDSSGDLVHFQAALLGTAGNSLTLNLNGGSATFAGQVGTNASEIGDIVVNDLAGTLDFQADVFASSLTSVSGDGDIILGGDLELRGVSADTINSLNLLASNATIEIHGDITSFASINIGSAAVLHGGGTNTITLTNGDSLVFGDTLDADAGESLTLNLNGGGASFNGEVGGVGALGDVLVNGLGGSLEFLGSLTAHSLTSAGGAGTVRLGDGDAGDLFTLTGVNGNGNALELDAAQINLEADFILGGNAVLTGPVRLFANDDGDVSFAFAVGADNSTLTFSGPLTAQGGADLVVDFSLINGGGATFAGTVGADDGDALNGADSLGDIIVINLEGTLAFDESVIARSLHSTSGAGTVEMGDGAGVDLFTFTGAGANAPTTNALVLVASDINLRGDFGLGGNAVFNGVTRLFGDGDGIITISALAGADDTQVAFIGPLTAQNSAGLTLDFSAISGGGAAFAAGVGLDDGDAVNGADSLGDILVINLQGTLAFDESVIADSLTSTSGSGTINLGDGAGVDVFTFLAANGAGNAVHLSASNATINLRGDVTALQAGAAIRMDSPLSVFDNRTITANNGLIDLASVLLDATGGNTTLSLLSNGGDIRVADGAGQTVRRDPGGLNQASMIINTLGGNATLGTVGDTAALTLLDVDAGAGTVSYTGNRYFAEQILLTGTQHLLPDTNIVFGDLNGVTSVVDLITIAGGNLVAFGGRTVDLNALNAGGNVNLFGARTGGANTTLNLRADNLVTLGTGDTIGNGVLFNRVNIVSGDVDIQNSIFANQLFLDPTGDLLNFGGGVGGMVVDAGEVAILNAGSLGRVFLGHDTRATFNTYNGITNLFGVSLIGNIEVYGNTTVDGVFQASTGTLELFGPTTLTNGAGLQTLNNGSGMTFFNNLLVMANTTLTTNNGALAFRSFIPGFGATNATINGTGAGTFDLAINTGTGRTTLFNVGNSTTLTNLSINSGQIFFEGQTYNALAQNYTSDDYRLRSNAAAVPLPMNFSGNTIVFNDAGGGQNAEILVLDGLSANFNFTNSFTSHAAMLGRALLGSADQNIVINATNQILFTDSIGWDGVGDPNADPTRFLGSVVMNSGNITVATVNTTGNQTYTAGNNVNLQGQQYLATGPSNVTFNGNLQLNPAGGTTLVQTGNGGTIGFNGSTITGNNNSLVATVGANGQINYAAGIAINNAAQQYTAGNYNFLGSAVITNSQPIAAVTFQGGTLNLGGNLAITTNGANSGITLGDNIVLNGFNLNAFANGAGSNATLGLIQGNGNETVQIRSNGLATLAGAQGNGVSILDIRSNLLNIVGNTIVDQARFRTFDPGRNISVGQNINSTLNISNNTLANLQPSGGMQNSLLIGENGYGGTITINNATINRNTTFNANGGGGIVIVQGNGLSGTGGVSNFTLTGNEVRLGGAINSNAGAFALNINGPTNIFGNAAITTNGGNVVFNNPINGLAAGAGFLDVNTDGGNINLPAGPIGQARALGQIRLVGAPTLTLPSVFTTGNQFYNSGNIVLLGGSAFNAQNGASIVFSGPVNALGNAQVQVSGNSAGNLIQIVNLLSGNNNAGQIVNLNAGPNGTVLLDGVGQPGSAVGVFTATGRTITTGDVLALGNITLNAGQTVNGSAMTSQGDITVNASQLNLGGDLLAQGVLTLNAGQTLLSGSRIFSASNIALNGDIDSQGAPAALTIENAALTTINGRLGGNSPLASFDSSDAGTTTLAGGGVFANGRVTFRNNVVVSGNATVQSLGDSAADGIRFLGTIDGSAPTTGSLSLIVDRTKGQLLGNQINNMTPDADVPLIELFGSVGLVNSLNTLAFNFGNDLNGVAVDGRAFVPANATIVLGNADAFRANGTLSDFTLNADQLLIGAREKLLALGSLKAEGSFARVGDMAAVTDLLVNYNQLTVLLREVGFIFDPTTQLAVEDVATDFVAGNLIQFGTITTLQALANDVNRPEFSVPGANANVLTGVGNFLFKSLDADITTLIIDNSGVLLDPRADGPSNTNIAEAIAGATPRQSQGEAAVTDRQLSQDALDALTALQISIKEPTDPSYLIDLREVATTDQARVSRRRLEPDLVTNLVESYNETFLVREVNDEGELVIVAFRRDEIRAVLQDAVAAYDTGDGDLSAAGLEAFLRQNAEQQVQALAEIDRLRQIVAGARLLGLTDSEIMNVKSRLVSLTLPENLTPAVFRDLIEPDQALLLGVR